MPTITTGTIADIPHIQQVAEKTWWPTYSTIISAEQISFMLAEIYGSDTLKNQIVSGSQTYLLLNSDTRCEGFASFSERADQPGVFKLNKIYVLPDNHGKGYGKVLIEEVKKRISQRGSHTLDLNVNRYNPAKSFYEKLGFKIIGEEDVPIGPYFMNDFVMRLDF